MSKPNFNEICKSGEYCHICRLSNEFGKSHRHAWQGLFSNISNDANFECPTGKPWITLTNEGDIIKTKTSKDEVPTKAIRLTIGMACYDDFDGVYFTITGIRAAHKEWIDQIDFLVIDNNPDSKKGKTTEDFCRSAGVKYMKYTEKKSTAIREQIFVHAQNPYVLCLDCHVIPDFGAIGGLIKYYAEHPMCSDLIHGPLVYDDNKSISTHMRESWNEFFYGQWETDPRGNDINNEAFDIPLQGLGLFSCRKDAWLGFNTNFRDFGGEEGYIHEKFRQAGNRVLCLPILRWHHRFWRPEGTGYPNNLVNRYHNYLLGWRELGMDTKPVDTMFLQKLSEDELNRVKAEVERELINMPPRQNIRRTPSTLMQKAANLASAVTGAAISVAKTSVGIDRANAELVSARLEICKSCSEAQYQNGQVFTCGQMLRSAMEKGEKTCGCILSMKSRDITQQCPQGKWQTVDLTFKKT